MSKRALTTVEFVEKAKQVHGNRYDYSKSEYVNSVSPVYAKSSDGRKLECLKTFLRNNKIEKATYVVYDAIKEHLSIQTIDL